jgi:glyoxylase-like metal-dependent hydrolase (beta-lactamase superfamily II)
MGAQHVIEGVQIVPMGMSNAFLIEGDDGLTLIDAGYPGKAPAVFRAIRGLGGSPDQLKHLIFTHGHPDHIGSAAAIVRETGARTYMHPLDIPMAESGGPFRPMRGAPGLLRQMMCKLFFHPEERTEPVAIDQPLTPGEILPIAGGFEVIHTPGHCMVLYPSWAHFEMQRSNWRELDIVTWINRKISRLDRRPLSYRLSARCRLLARC